MTSGHPDHTSEAQRAPSYEAYKVRERVWGVVLRLGDGWSIDQRLRFGTRREAVSCAFLFQAEQDALNAEQREE